MELDTARNEHSQLQEAHDGWKQRCEAAEKQRDDYRASAERLQMQHDKLHDLLQVHIKGIVYVSTAIEGLQKIDM